MDLKDASARKVTESVPSLRATRLLSRRWAFCLPCPLGHVWAICLCSPPRSPRHGCAFSLFVRVDSAPVFHLGARTRPARRLRARGHRGEHAIVSARPRRKPGKKRATRMPSGAPLRIAQVRRSRGRPGFDTPEIGVNRSIFTTGRNSVLL